ncbi:phage minor capsid protein [Flavonifractor sp. An306]|uniref:phage minor capsid protein n=1 Tax=Flavonifractor sp. An306 TaxID=1965629 RepID=UPI000B3AFCAA|nr:phage minor capsid protein [Flavonifractor sp. An306]OUO34719.1 hypothetical protein B5F88_15590 [Flavonifractor sp. An306]
MPTLQRAPNGKELEKLISIYLKAETDIINEIGRLRSRGLVDYHAVAALERVQTILRKLENDAWEYVPKMIEKQFYVRVPEARKALEVPETAAKHAAGYMNAAALTGEQMNLVQMLTQQLMGEITDAAMTAMATIQSAILGRVEPDVYRRVGLEQVAAMQATGKGVNAAVPGFVEALRREGITAFVDRAGRRWSLHTYCSMVTRTTSRQAEIAAVLSADPEQDLYKISSHGTTCAICAPYEGRVYSRSGTDPDFPALADAFGKIDPSGSDNLANTYLNIHPNCLVPGGTVLAEGVMAHTSREYSGPVITLETSAGNRITVTPNHPILTTAGFVPAAQLQEGQKIVEATWEYRFLFGEAPNDVNIPTPVEDIGHSIVQSGGGTSVCVEGTPKQFHGDGIANSEVKIVLPEGFVEGKLNPLGSKPVGKKGFPSGHFGRHLFLPSGPLFKILQRPRHATHCIMRRLGFGGGVKTVSVESKKPTNVCERTTTLLGNLRKSESLIVEPKKFLELFGTGLDISRRHIKELFPLLSLKKPVVDHGTFDGVLSYPEMLRDLRISEPLAAQRLQCLFRDNALVVSKLVHVDTSEYHGTVYNLETKYGFYTYNNIVTHNCLHVLIPWTTAGRTPEEIQKIKDFSNPQKNPYSVDPRSKKQIGAYRKKEIARKHWLERYRQWEMYRMTLGDKVPKTYQTFERHKLANDDKYREWERLYREANAQ